MKKEQKYRLRFFFDYGCGGCLWPDNKKTYDDFDFGPIDKVISEKTNKLSISSLKLINEIDNEHSDYLNKTYPNDPSLWRKEKCEKFNLKVDILFKQLIKELGSNFEINNQQIRYEEDPNLDEYLKDPINFKRSKTTYNTIYRK